MKAGSMGGLIGASINMEISKTPMKVYKEAEGRGDTEVMKRSMAYASDFQEKAKECSDRAQEELAKELKEECREQEIKREQAIEKRGEEAKENRENIQEKSGSETKAVDSLEISDEGKAAIEQQSKTGETTAAIDNSEIKTYNSAGKALSIEQDSVSVDIKVGL